jgi:sialate O-acetylesterase
MRQPTYNFSVLGSWLINNFDVRRSMFGVRRSSYLSRSARGGLVGNFILAVCLAFLLSGRLHAAVRLAAPFRDGVVLQSGKPIAVWGWAEPGEQVKVSFKQCTRTAQADSRGRWLVRLEAVAASDQPARLVVAGKNTVTVDQVLVGEVWLCSGQSNMNLPLTQAKDAEREIAGANHPLIRYFEVKSAVVGQPLDEAGGTWETCTPAAAGRFTAVGYFFARELQRQLGVPVGIIKSTLGGSPIEGWMSEETLKGNLAADHAVKTWAPLSAAFEKRTADYAAQLATWSAREKAARAAGRDFAEPRPVIVQERSDRNKPSGLYNGFIHPLEPLTLAGFLWYQGESGVGRANEYRVLLQTMIRQWRQDFQQPDLPFLIAQLPNYAETNDVTGQSWAWLREAQAATLSLPRTGMAVTVDVGDPANLHPANKQDVGLRLALVALRDVYRKRVESSGPVFAGVKQQGDSLQILFKQADGLFFKGEATNAFVIAGSDRKFIPAEARIVGQSVVLSAKGIAEPQAVRYNWENNPRRFLYNRAGLPAAPFRTDSW